MAENSIEQALRECPNLEYPGGRSEVCRTPIFTVESEAVHMPSSGRTDNFYRLVCPDWVNVVAITPANELVMIVQFRHGDRKPHLEIPGGVISTNENPVFAGLRELREETGFAGRTVGMIGKVCPNPAIQDNLCHTLLVMNAVRTHDTDFDPMESIRTVLVPLDEALDCASSGQVTNGLVLNALHFLEIWLKNVTSPQLSKIRI